MPSEKSKGCPEPMMAFRTADLAGQSPSFLGGTWVGENTILSNKPLPTRQNFAIFLTYLVSIAPYLNPWKFFVDFLAATIDHGATVLIQNFRMNTV